MRTPGCIICGAKLYVDDLCSKCYDSYRQSCISGHHCPLDDNLPRNVLRWAVMRTKRMMKKETR